MGRSMRCTRAPEDFGLASAAIGPEMWPCPAEVGRDNAQRARWASRVRPGTSSRSTPARRFTSRCHRHPA